MCYRHLLADLLAVVVTVAVAVTVAVVVTVVAVAVAAAVVAVAVAAAAAVVVVAQQRGSSSDGIINGCSSSSGNGVVPGPEKVKTEMFPNQAIRKARNRTFKYPT